ncbi:MAG: hypothetical protein M3O36_11735 [Myxococcota bacterium]|nr:hypothetical protein [Myxococcota bacterium]
MKLVLRWLGVLSVIRWTLACNSVLGIDPAALDPDAGPSPDGQSAVGDSGAGPQAPEPLTCNHYCDVVMQNCQGTNLEYLTRDICMGICPVFELGTRIDDTANDTLGCRLWHANSASLEPDVHCRHAGPVGGDRCGGLCPAFCNIDTAYCSGANTAYDGGLTVCEGACAAYPYVTGLDAGDLGSENGDTLNCRLWHLESAFAPGAAAFHCPHTALVSDKCK